MQGSFPHCFNNALRAGSKVEEEQKSWNKESVKEGMENSMEDLLIINKAT